MNTTVQLDPTVQFWPDTACYIRVSDVYIHMSQQIANCQITFLDSGLAPINSSTRRWTMDSGCYVGWGLDDDYFMRACLSGLNLTAAT